MFARTLYSHYTDEELARLATNAAQTPLEVELAQRLCSTLDTIHQLRKDIRWFEEGEEGEV